MCGELLSLLLCQVPPERSPLKAPSQTLDQQGENRKIDYYYTHTHTKKVVLRVSLNFLSVNSLKEGLFSKNSSKTSPLLTRRLNTVHYTISLYWTGTNRSCIAASVHQL